MAQGEWQATGLRQSARPIRRRLCGRDRRVFRSAARDYGDALAGRFALQDGEGAPAPRARAGRGDARLTAEVWAGGSMNAFWRSGVPPSWRGLHGTGVNSGSGDRSLAGTGVRLRMGLGGLAGGEDALGWGVGRAFTHLPRQYGRWSIGRTTQSSGKGLFIAARAPRALGACTINTE